MVFLHLHTLAKKLHKSHPKACHVAHNINTHMQILSLPLTPTHRRAHTQAHTYCTSAPLKEYRAVPQVLQCFLCHPEYEYNIRQL